MRIAGGTAKRITKRIINFILVIWGVVTLSFCLQVFTGTDPAEMIVARSISLQQRSRFRLCERAGTGRSLSGTLHRLHKGRVDR